MPFITAEQFTKIGEEYKSPLYHPNLIIRILLFIATLFALSGMSGILGAMFWQIGETFIYFGCIVYGIGSFVALEKMFIANTPLGRRGQPEDIAKAAVFLASDDTAWRQSGS